MKSIKRFLTIGLALLLMLCIGAGLIGCKRIVNRITLQQIPKEGNYIFLNSSAGITIGNDYVDIEAEALKVIRKETNLLFASSSDFYSILSEDGKSMQFIMCYDSKHHKDDYFSGEFKFAIGSTPLPYVDIKIDCYLPTQNDGHFRAFNSQGNYFYCEDEENFYAINRTTYEMTSFAGRYQNSFDTFSSDGGGFILYKSTDEGWLYRIFDEHLTEYQVLLTNEWQNGRVSVRDGYIFHYVAGNQQEQCVCFNYKTGEQLDKEQALSLYETFFGTGTVVSVKNLFEYNGKRYTWESDSEQSENELAGLTIQNFDTGEEYRLEPTKLTGDGAKVLSQLSGMYPGLTWRSIFVADGELFFVLVNDESFFGMSTSQNSPRIVFKYDETKKQLAYVGYSMGTHYGIQWIYNVDKLS